MTYVIPTDAANFEVVVSESTPDFVVLNDLGPHHAYKTITNAAEEVVARCFAMSLLQPGQRLFYYDSEGELAEILIDQGRFAGFRPLAPGESPK